MKKRNGKTLEKQMIFLLNLFQSPRVHLKTSRSRALFLIRSEMECLEVGETDWNILKAWGGV